MEQSALKSRPVWAWAFYDFANSSFGVLFLSLLYPVYFRQALAGADSQADLWWGLCSGGSVALAAFLSPFLGAKLDQKGRHRHYLIALSVLCVLCTAALSASPHLAFALVVLLFVLANVCYFLSMTVYDCYLPMISSPERRGTVSGFGWSMGYLGGLVASLAFSPWYRPGFAGAAEANYLFSFLLVAVFFFVFALPAFYLLPQPRPSSQADLQSSIFARVRQTLASTSQYQHIFRLVLGYSLSYCALNTIFSFFSIYASVTLGASVPEVTVVFLIFQIVGLPAVFVAGKIGDFVGLDKVLLVSVVGWIVLILALLAKPSLSMLYGLSAMAGCLAGPTSSSARALVSKLSPPEKSSEIMGFLSFAARLAAALGPVAFGAVSWLADSQQVALAFQLLFLVAALLLLQRACGSRGSPQ